MFSIIHLSSCVFLYSFSLISAYLLLQNIILIDDIWIRASSSIFWIWMSKVLRVNVSNNIARANPNIILSALWHDESILRAFWHRNLPEKRFTRIHHVKILSYFFPISYICSESLLIKMWKIIKLTCAKKNNHKQMLLLIMWCWCENMISLNNYIM